MLLLLESHLLRTSRNMVGECDANLLLKVGFVLAGVEDGLHDPEGPVRAGKMAHQHVWAEQGALYAAMLIGAMILGPHRAKVEDALACQGGGRERHHIDLALKLTLSTRFINDLLTYSTTVLILIFLVILENNWWDCFPLIIKLICILRALACRTVWRKWEWFLDDGKGLLAGVVNTSQNTCTCALQPFPSAKTT